MHRHHPCGVGAGSPGRRPRRRRARASRPRRRRSRASAGRILDRKHNELAVSEDAADIVATPYQVRDQARTAAKLAPLVHMSPTAVEHAFHSGSSGFAYLAHQVSLPDAAKIRKLDLPGISTLPSTRRVYPEGDLASQVIGTVGTENQGLTGLEAADDSVLAGRNGERQVVLDGLGKELVRHTVTPVTQDRTCSSRSTAAFRREPRRCSRARRDLPTARRHRDRHEPAEQATCSRWPTGRRRPQRPGGRDRGRALQNMATGFTYEPGSTFKAFTVAGRSDRPQGDAEHAVRHSHRAPGRRPHDHRRRAARARDASQWPRSSLSRRTSAPISIGARVGATRFNHWVRTFGFAKPTGIAFPGEEQGIVPKPSQYSGSTMGNLPIGQGLSVTPIQMAAAYSAIANGGILRTPSSIEREGDRRIPKSGGHRIISQGRRREAADHARGRARARGHRL